MCIYTCVCILHTYVCKFIYLPYNIYLSYWCSEERMHGLFVCLSKLQENITAVWRPFLWWASFLALAFTDSLMSPLLWLLIYISITLDSLIVGRPSLTSCAALSDILHVVDHQDVFGINTYFFSAIIFFHVLLHKNHLHLWKWKLTGRHCSIRERFCIFGLLDGFWFSLPKILYRN